MRGDASTMKVLRPADAKEAVRLYAKHPDALPLAGGTDLLVAWNIARLNGKTILDLWRINAWRSIQKVICLSAIPETTGSRFSLLMASIWVSLVRSGASQVNLIDPADCVSTTMITCMLSIWATTEFRFLSCGRAT